MRTSTKSLAAGFCVTGLLLAGCGSSSDGTTSNTDGASSSQATEDVTISDAWARTSAQGTSTGVIYMEISASADDELVGVSVASDIAATAEIHETTMDDESEEGHSGDEDDTSEDDTSEDGTDDDTSGNMTMSEVESIDLPAGETIALKPGSYHIMLMELVEPLTAGQSIEVTLEFKNAGTKTVTAEVRDA